MNALVTLSYEDRLKAEYKARRARFAAAARQVGPEKPILRIAPTPVAVPVYVAHVSAYEAWQRMYEPSTQPKEFVRLACRIEGFKYDVITGYTRGTMIVAARYRLIRLTKDRYPDLSLGAIGHLFHKDHTVIARALRDVNTPKRWVKRLTEEDVLAIRRLYRDFKHSPKQLSAEFEVNNSTICKIVRRQTWRHI